MKIPILTLHGISLQITESAEGCFCIDSISFLRFYMIETKEGNCRSLVYTRWLLFYVVEVQFHSSWKSVRFCRYIQSSETLVKDVRDPVLLEGKKCVRIPHDMTVTNWERKSTRFLVDKSSLVKSATFWGKLTSPLWGDHLLPKNEKNDDKSGYHSSVNDSGVYSWREYQQKRENLVFGIGCLVFKSVLPTYTLEVAHFSVAQIQEIL